MISITKKTQSLSGYKSDNIPNEVFSSITPIILKGIVSDWPLTQKVDTPLTTLVSQLKKYYNGRPVPTYFADAKIKGRLSYNDNVTQLNFDKKQANVNDILDEIISGIGDNNSPLRYIASSSVDQYFPELRKKNDISFDNEYFTLNRIDRLEPMVGIWIGNKTIAPCHYDAQNNIACCIAGKRKFTLFPPDQIENLYPGPLEPTPGGQAISMVDFSQPDFVKYPKFKSAIRQGEIAELEPGDALYIPSMWWHQVESTSSFNTLINYWWDTTPRIRGQGMHALHHALLSLRDKPESEKKAWKHIFDYYIFGDSDLASKHLPEKARGVLGPIDNLNARQLRALLINKLNR